MNNHSSNFSLTSRQFIEHHHELPLREQDVTADYAPIGSGRALPHWLTVMACFLMGLILLPITAAAQDDDPYGLVHQLPASEYGALVSFYNSTDLYRGVDPLFWGAFLEVEGVEYDLLNQVVATPGHLTLLAVGNRHGWFDEDITLGGSISPLIGNLPSLRKLDLLHTGLTGEIPASIGNLSALSELRLNENQLTGPIPDSIGNLRELTILHLYSNQLTGAIPTSIGNLTKLESLELKYNNLTGAIPSTIGNLTWLNWLDLRGDVKLGSDETSPHLQLGGEIPASIGNLTKLIYLDLSRNELTGSIPSSIGNLTELTNLDLRSDNLAGDIPNSIGNLFKLTSCDLGHNELTGSIPASIGNLTGLKFLSLTGNRLSGRIPSESLVNCPGLDLWLNDNYITLDSEQRHRFSAAGLPWWHWDEQHVPNISMEPFGIGLQVDPLRWDEARFFPTDFASLKVTNNEDFGPVVVTLESQNDWLEVKAPFGNPGPVATVELAAHDDTVFEIFITLPPGSPCGEYVGSIKAYYGGGVTNIPVSYKYSTAFAPVVKNANTGATIAGATIHMVMPSPLLFDATTGPDGVPDSAWPVWVQGTYRYTAEAPGYFVSDPDNPVAGVVSGASGIWGEVLLMPTGGPVGGTMKLTPASPLKPNSTLTANFAGWTDVNLPLSYTVLVDEVVVSPAGPTASRTFAGPAIPGQHTMKGRITNALGAVTEVTRNFTVDNTAPGVSLATLTSNNSRFGWAKLGSRLTLRFTTNESIQAPVVTLLGVAAEVANPNGNNWTATVTVGATTIQGPAAFSIIATDVAGNTATAATATTDGSIITVDRTPPTLHLPTNFTTEIVGVVNFSASVSDNLDPEPSLSVAPQSGSIFPVGTTTVNASSTDAAGNTATASFTVTVLDTIAPAVAPPANAIVEATSAAGAVVNYAAATAIDAVGVTEISYSQSSGTTFAIGVTTVTVTARDVAGNMGTATFRVTVRDTTAPVLTPSQMVTAVASNPAGAVVSYPAVTATDAVGVVSVTYSKESGTNFPVGVTPVTVTATDAAGNTATATIFVAVTYTSQPGGPDANLVQDGGFESPVVAGEAGSIGLYNPGETFGGAWRVDAAEWNVVVVANDRDPFFHTPEGNQFLYLGNVWSASTLVQDLATLLQADRNYTLTFLQSAFTSGFLDAGYTGLINVRLRPTGGGDPVFNQDFSVPAFASWVGKSATLSVPATGNYTLELRSFNDHPAVVDYVSLSLAPEPVPGQLAEARRFHTATLLPNGNVLVAGGYNDSGYLASAELYHPGTDTWTTVGNLSVARAYHTATLLPNGRVLIAGGEGLDAHSLAGAEIYDPATGLWSVTGSMGTARNGLGTVLLPNGRVLAAGGYDDLSNSHVTSAELYDPATGLWSPTGSLADGRRYAALTLLGSGQVLVAGGFVGNGYLASSELYDPVSGIWNPTGSLGTACYGSATTLLPDGRVLLAGGFYWNGWEGEHYLAAAEVYDPATGLWSPTGAMASGRFAGVATVLANGKVLVSGGNGPAYRSLDTTEIFDPASGLWFVGQSLSTTRAGHTATLLINGSVLLTAGFTFNGSFAHLATSEIYQDTVAPIVANHANVIVEATSAAGAVVNYEPGSASDAGGVVSIAYSQNSGTLFPIGTTTVTITATDAANNTGTGTFTVTVAGVPAIVVEQPAGDVLTANASTVSFGNVTHGANVLRTFTIRNAGTAPLAGLEITKDGTSPAEFSVGVPGATSLNPGESTTFTVTFSPAASGARSAAIHIASNDAAKSPFDVALSGTGVALAAGENGFIYVSNADSGTVGKYFDSGAVVNVGLVSDLGVVLSLAVSNACLYICSSNGLKLYSTSGIATNLSPNASCFGKMVLQGTTLYATDLNQGTVSKITDSGEQLGGPLISGLQFPTGVATDGTHLYVGELTNHRIGKYNLDGSVVNAALIPRIYPRAIAIGGDCIYVVDDFGTIGKYKLDGSEVNASLITGLGGPGSHGPYDLAVSGTRLFVPIYDDGVVREYTTDGELVNASLISGLTGPGSIAVEPPPAPELIVEQPSGTSLTDNASTVDFGSLALGANIVRTFTIRNAGAAQLTGLEITRDGTNPAEFSVGAPGATTLAPGVSTTFTVTFSPTATGARNAAIHIASNDATKSPFDITLSGTGTTPPGSRTIITFSTFPGPDNILGNADDVAITPPYPPTSAVWFTTEYARLAGGVGVVVDSKTSPVSPVRGAIMKWNYGGLNNVLVQARPHVGPGSSSAAAVDYRFVNSADGVTPAVVSLVEFDFVPGIATGHNDAARFYNSSGTLLATANYVDGTGSSHVSYANAAGIAKVSITTDFSVATDNFTFETLPAPTANNARLQNLSLTGVALSPVFNASTLTYTATVPFSTSSVTITPTTVDPAATVRVNGTAVPSGMATGPVNLAVGANSISTVVTAADYVTTLAYTVLLTRQTAVQSWRQTNFGTPDATGDAADEADPDHDGLTNKVEFAFGLNPRQGGSLQLPQAQRIGGNYVISFSQPTGVSGITYGAEWSTSLTEGSWLLVVDSGAGSVHTFSVPIGNNQKMFLRLIVTSP